MTRQRVSIWVGAFMCSLLLGCASMRSDPLADNHTLPDEIDAQQGFLTETTDTLMSSAKSSMGLGPSEDVARTLFQSAMEEYRNAGALQGAARQKAFDDVARSFAKAASRISTSLNGPTTDASVWIKQSVML